MSCTRNTEILQGSAATNLNVVNAVVKESLKYSPFDCKAEVNSISFRSGGLSGLE